MGVELCRGLVTATISSKSGTVVGIKPFSLATTNMAVLTNTMALCPSDRILVELHGVNSVDEATKKCLGTAGCTHYSLTFGASRSTSMDKQGFVICSGDLVAVPREGAVT